MCSSKLPLVLSIQPKHSAVRTASGQVRLGTGADFLCSTNQIPVSRSRCSLSQSRQCESSSGSKSSRSSLIASALRVMPFALMGFEIIGFVI